MEQLPPHIIAAIATTYEARIRELPPAARRPFLLMSLPKLRHVEPQLREEVTKRSAGVPITQYLLDHNEFNWRLQRYCC